MFCSIWPERHIFASLNGWTLEIGEESILDSGLIGKSSSLKSPKWMKPSYPRVNELSHEGFLSLPSWSDASRCEKHCLDVQVRLQRSRGMQFSDGFDLEAIIFGEGFRGWLHRRLLVSVKMNDSKSIWWVSHFTMILCTCLKCGFWWEMLQL